MSREAERQAEACRHPTVRGAARALLELLATRIPEGDTMTGPISIDELATASGYYDQAIRKALKRLAAAGVLRIVGGGQGRTAAYELLALPHAGADPVLPLLGAARPPASSADPRPLLALADSEQPAKNFGAFHRSWRAYFGAFHRGTSVICTDVRDKWAAVCLWLVNFGAFHRSTPAAPLGVPLADARARDVHTFKNVHTPAAPAPPLEAPGPAPPGPRRPRHPWHAWCGPVCVPRALHDELVRKGHDPAWLTAFYGRTCAALGGAPIAENDFQFWRAALKAARGSPPARSRPRSAAAPTPPGPPCPHDPECVDGVACVDRQLAEWQRAQATG